jgi:hypothetical protein
MTNTLHRYGNAESFHDDFIVFACPSRGKNDQNCIPKLKRFLEIALEFRPIGLGNTSYGGVYRPYSNLTPRAHWKRDFAPDFCAVIDSVDQVSLVSATFDNLEAAQDFFKAVKTADFGLSVNISTSIEGAKQCCCAAKQPRHSLGYSLGFEGDLEKLPNSQVLTLTTMCGHGLVSASMAKKMIDWVKEGRRTPEQAVTYLARFCSCGVFNTARAKRVLEEARRKLE